MPPLKEFVFAHRVKRFEIKISIYGTLIEEPSEFMHVNPKEL